MGGHRLARNTDNAGAFEGTTAPSDMAPPLLGSFAGLVVPADRTVALGRCVRRLSQLGRMSWPAPGYPAAARPEESRTTEN
jgi:hypothetical protein